MTEPMMNEPATPTSFTPDVPFGYAQDKNAPGKKSPLLPILLVLVVLVSVGIAGFMWRQNQQLQKQITEIKQGEVQKTIEEKVAPTAATDPTEGWETYSNTQFGFSFQYPPTWKDVTDSETISQGNREFRLQTDKNEYVSGIVFDKTDSTFVDQLWNKQIKLNNSKALVISYTDNIGPGSKGGTKDLDIFDQILETFESEGVVEPTVKPVSISIPKDWVKNTATDPYYGLTTSLTLPSELKFSFRGSETVLYTTSGGEQWNYVTSLYRPDEKQPTNTYKGGSRREWFQSYLNGDYGRAKSDKKIVAVNEESAGKVTFLKVTLNSDLGDEQYYLIVQNGIIHLFEPLTVPSDALFTKNAAAVLSTINSTLNTAQ